MHTLRTCLTNSSLSASASSSSLGVSSERVLRLAAAGERGRGDEVPLPLFLDWEEIGLNSQQSCKNQSTCMATEPPFTSPLQSTVHITQIREALCEPDPHSIARETLCVDTLGQLQALRLLHAAGTPEPQQVLADTLGF